MRFTIVYRVCGESLEGVDPIILECRAKLDVRWIMNHADEHRVMDHHPSGATYTGQPPCN